MKPSSQKLLTAAGVIALILVMYSLPSLVLQDKTDLMRSWQRLISPPPTSVETLNFINSRHLAYSVEKVDVNDLGATLKPGIDYAEIFTLSQLAVPVGGSVIDFSEEAVVPKGASIGYQISTDSSHWFYFNGSKWDVVSQECKECFNPAALVAARIGDLTFSSDAMKVKVALSGSGDSRPTLRSVSVTVRGELSLMKPDQRQSLEDLRVGFVKASAKDHKITVCHVPPGNPENAHEITIDESALQAHLDNNPGDSQGPCPTPPPVTCTPGKVIVCHVPPGYPENAHEILVGESALQAHLADNPGDSLGTCPAPAPAEPKPGKVIVCHVPPGNPENAHEITIDESALQAHLANNPGDSQGACPAAPVLTCEPDKVIVCHVPPGNPENAHEIEIDASAVQDHLANNPGDTLGSCPPPPPPPPPPPDDWDKSDLSVTGACLDPNVVFTVQNGGEAVIGDMQGPTAYRIYRNNNLEEQGNLQLAGGASQRFTVAAYGDKMVMTVDQRPGFPGDPSVTESVSFCGQQDGNKVPICHVPPGNPENAHTIYIAESAVEDHLAHNPLDSRGACQAANRAPVAQDDTATIAQGTTIDIPVLNNDSDPDGNLDPSSLSIVQDPPNGRATVKLTTVDGVVQAAITYTPNAGFSGTDTFSYRICDSGTPPLCDEATVTVHVSKEPPANRPPVAVDDEAVTSKDTPVEIFVLNNDSDPDGWLDLASLSIVSYPHQGTVSINATTGTITYTPLSGMTGADRFKYQICDNGSPRALCDEAYVDVTITSGPINQPPVVVDDTAATTRDTPVTIDVLANDSDPDGGLDPSSLAIDDPPVHGTVVITPDHQVIYTPDPGYTGPDKFRYKVCDNGSPVICATGLVNLTVSPPARTPPLVVDDTAITLINTPINIVVLANDSDAGGVLDPSTVAIVSPPTHGRVAVDPSSGVVNYTPDLSYVGDDLFRYQVCNDVGLCDTAAVSVSIVTEPPHHNQPPVVNNDGAVTDINTPVTIDVLANDHDPDGTLVTTTVTIVQSTPGTTITVDPATGKVTYTPPPGFAGNDTFIYQVCDNGTPTACGTATVTVTVFDHSCSSCAPANAPPVANDDTATTSVNTPTVINVLANDSDADGTLDPASVSIVSGSGPANGTVTVSAVTGQITYTPNAGFAGTDTFRYSVCDNTISCATAKVTVEVRSASSLTPPVANDDKAATAFETSVTLAVLDNDFDIDGFLVANSLRLVTPPKNGAAAVGPEPGQMTYMPQAGFSGIDTFTYEVCDNDGLCDIADVNVTVTTPVVPPPTPPPPRPPAPTIIPTLVLPAPPVLVVSPTINLSCNVPVYQQSTIDLSGFYSGQLAADGQIQYSLTNGNSWNPVEQTSLVAAGTNFGFTLRDLQDGEYSARARVTSGAAASALASAACNFVVDTGLIFGANQFVLASQPAPMTATGTIQFIVGQPQTFYLEAKGATRALVRNLDTKETQPLMFDSSLKLWTGRLVFNQPGFYRLGVEIGNSLRTYTREINSVLVTEQSGILDASDGQPLDGVKLTVFQKNVETGEFIQWRGEAYGQDNPTVVNGAFSVILPAGDYYLRLEKAGYVTLSSLITTLKASSVVSALVRLPPTGGFLGQISQFVTPSGTGNNFTLQIAPAPETKLLDIGKAAPDFAMTASSGLKTTLLRELDKDNRPTVLFIYSTWNTEAQVQIDIYNRVVARLGAQYRFIPVATLEPSSVGAVQSGRGAYGLDFFKPADEFYQNYHLTSLPVFLAIGPDKKLLGSLTGRRSEDELVNWAQATLGQ